MPAIKLLNIFALSTLAILLCSLAPSQTLAVSIRSNHLARQLPNHHDIAGKKRGTKRCKPRSSSSAPKPTSVPSKDDPAKSDPSPSTTQPPKNVETKPPTTTPTGSGKLAIAWGMGNDKRVSLLSDSKRVRMFHLWDSEIPSALKNTGIPVSIMLWGTPQDKIDKFLRLAKPGYATHAFGFNEVNEPQQANLGVKDAVDAWYKYLRPRANDGYTLGSPSSSGNPNGLVWMKQFISDCGNDCHIDEMLVHWYDLEVEDFKAWIEKWAAFGKPIRVTEFACQNFNGGSQPSMDHVWDFTDKAIKFMEADQRILSYAPYGFFDLQTNGELPGGVNANNKLFVKDGLSDLGWKYVNGQ